ncbi:aminotransferase class V-fold PLP-dependent enzyme [bacterium]|nr:MAG: aminotransferase class V-fold PLP-dependent enzyme [bacterium]
MIPIFKPYMPNQLDELSNILNSGALAYGHWGKSFEAKLGEFIGVDEVITTNSYNSAMLVLISTLGLQCGDEILASPMSCLASNQPFLTKGLKVKWVDIDPLTGTIDPQSLSENINKKSKAIFHNHYCGIPGHIDEINQIAKENGVFVVDDCIEAFGSEYKGRVIGNTGADATIFSFQTVRLPNTIDGGALVFKDPIHLEKAKQIRDYGIDRTNFRDKNKEISITCDIKLEGYGALMSELNSYIGYKQMENLEELLTIQRRNAELWRNYLQQYHSSINLLGYRENIYPNFWVFGILTQQKLTMLEYFRNLGYYASGIHVNNNIYSAFGAQTNLKGVNSFYKQHLALPSGWWIDENQLKNVICENN